MAPVNPCLYCYASTSSDEHVISEALGCKEVIKEGVCRDCNSAFGHRFEGKFVNGLALPLNFFQIPNGEGVVPSVQLRGKLGSEEFKFLVTGNGKAEVPPKLLRNRKTPDVVEKVFRIFHAPQERKIGDALRSRHQDLIWEQDREAKTKLLIEAEPEFDPALLCGSEANRSVAKYAVNLLIHQYGYDWAKARLRDLIAYIKDEPSSTRVGALWGPDLLKGFPFAPPKHLFVVVCESRTHTVTVFLHLFCLLPYCVIAEDPRILIDSITNGALDPYKGRFTPLFLSGRAEMLERRSLPPFPMPEFEFSDRLRSAEIGTLKQATRAADNVLEFMRAVYSARPGVPHICYYCRKILTELTPVCAYCGRSPLPETK
jgi:hypothetical protein